LIDLYCVADQHLQDAGLLWDCWQAAARFALFGVLCWLKYFEKWQLRAPNSMRPGSLELISSGYQIDCMPASTLSLMKKASGFIFARLGCSFVVLPLM
jgi:hypothetical protein